MDCFVAGSAVYRVEDPERYGVVEFGEGGKAITAAAAVSVAVTTRPVPPRPRSVRSTAAPVGLTQAGVGVQAARAPTAAAVAPRARKRRRVRWGERRGAGAVMVGGSLSVDVAWRAV